ncbi:Ribosome maturation factor RimM [bacterium HR29]|nr:Ribosome maturation factor RimM [bacterium HR29]
MRGELRVAPFDPEAPNLQPGGAVWAGERRYPIRGSRPAGGGAWLLALEGVSSRDEAEALRGALLEVPDAELRRSSEDAYFVFELLGLRVVTDSGHVLGVIEEVLATGANDVYVVRSGEREILVPAIGEVVQSVDLTAGEVRITPLPGLFDDSP